ncbi:peptidase [Nitrincola tibetensis]|uniref:Peptidase n=1 Tax=Nitrincola tibetensis TaxID=2219697 RepID=A0A364NHF4_9GAMM|nr:M48 family metallopeptidase [Nitrincola tibetensis]RAU16493.1 peptidase [Nitrincola tibetensis]
MRKLAFVRNTTCTLGLAITLTLSGCKTTGSDMSGLLSAGMGMATAITMTDQQMKLIGDQSIAHLDSQHQIAPQNSRYAQRLTQLTQGWETVDGQSLEYKVYILPEINAFAVPNGSIRMYSGLMDEMTDDEVRYVIAHEIGHVVLGHSKRAFQVAYAASAAREAAAASGNSTAAALSNSELGELGEKLVNAQFSQTQEHEADDYAIKLMQRHGMNADASVTALRKLEAKYGNSRSLFSSHPAAGDRADRLSNSLR